MFKTTLYLPEALKTAVASEAARRRSSEADVMREAIANAVAGFERQKPRGGFLTGDWEPVDWNTNDWLDGFGES
ncbi:MAG: ribbon-helix-helix domain-containing protein [Bifidobacteriaceae bacterium]|jgi:hypothetical protein|nr:ribbon-helix-helix domain-containing protein [Bifidobacteriaceae bacterium]